MDAISVVTTVFSLLGTIINWIDDRNESDGYFLRLRQTISDIHNIIAPLTAPRECSTISHSSVATALRSLGDVLRATEQNLRLWEHSNARKIFAFLAPAKVASRLKEDEARLGQHLIILMGALSISGYTNSNNSRLRLHNTVPNELFALEGITNVDIKTFWSDYVGAKISFVSTDDFFHKLQLWLKKRIDTPTRNRLLWRLDEFGSDGVTPTSLQKLLGNSSLRDIVKFEIHNYSNSKLRFNDSSPESDGGKFRLKLPLLIWVDDKPYSNTSLVKYARRKGVNVIQLPSTALAKALIDSNEAFLRANDCPSRIRFISDQSRFENTTNSPGPYLNRSAGQDLLRFLRGRQYGFRFLVYTGRSLAQTRYVLKYDAGSTGKYFICRKYIEALANGDKNDLFWKSFMASNVDS